MDKKDFPDLMMTRRSVMASGSASLVAMTASPLMANAALPKPVFPAVGPVVLAFDVMPAPEGVS